MVIRNNVAKPQKGGYGEEFIENGVGGGADGGFRCVGAEPASESRKQQSAGSGVGLHSHLFSAEQHNLSAGGQGWDS